MIINWIVALGQYILLLLFVFLAFVVTSVVFLFVSLSIKGIIDYFR